MSRPVSRRVAALAVAAVGLVLCAVGLAVDPTRAFLAWLMAWGFALSIALGALILVLICNAAGARWFEGYRRLAEGLAATLVPLAILFVPLAFGLRRLYPWAAPSEELRHELGHRLVWLDPGFFLVRSAIYLVLFAVAALVSRRHRVLSAALLPPVALALTFGAVDWLMSLDPTWTSQVYGIYYWSGGFVAAIALLALLARDARPSDSYALGRMLLAFVVFWTYIAYAQGFIIWIGNKPDEVTWYVRRTTGGWGAVAVVLFVLHFVVPFAVLLLRWVKLRARRLAAVAALVVVAHLIDLYWMVMPALQPHPSPSWLDLAALAAVLGVCAATMPGERGEP